MATEVITSTEFEYPVEIVDATLTTAELVGSGRFWEVSATVQGEPWLGEFPREFMLTAPQLGAVYRFELTKQYAYDAGEREIVGVTTPTGQRSGLTPNQIWERQVRAKIEHALSEMSTIGYAAGYLNQASSDAWNLVIGGPRRADEAAEFAHGKPDEMRAALTTVLTVAARRGWWPKEIYDADGFGLQGYTKVPLAQQHQQHPIPGLTAETDSAQVYRQLAKMWNLETPEPSSIES